MTSSLDEEVVRSCRIEVNPPAPPGEYVEPFTTIEIKQNPLVLMSSIGEYLAQNNITFKINWDKFRFKCSSIIDEETIVFHINLFSSPVSGTYYVECQKRLGCGFKFQSIYRKLLSALLNISNIDVEVRSSENYISLDKECMVHILDMARSSNILEKSEALRFLTRYGKDLDRVYIPEVLSITHDILRKYGTGTKNRPEVADTVRCAQKCYDRYN